MSPVHASTAKVTLDASTDQALAAFRDKRHQGSATVTAAEFFGAGLSIAVSAQFPALGTDAARLTGEPK